MVLTPAFVAGNARASFVYSVAPVTTSTNFGAGSNLTVSAPFGGGNSGVMAGIQTISLGQVTASTTTAPPASDSGNIPLAPLVVKIINQNGGGQGSFIVNGTFNVTAINTSGVTSTYTPGALPPSLILGSYTYTLSNPVYTAPTPTLPGSLTYRITEVGPAVPEPSSFVLAGMGITMVGAMASRRRKA
jgi:hypothetical protein